MTELEGKKVAMIVDNYFEEAELIEPLHSLEAAGAQVEIIAPQAGTVQGMHHAEPANTFKVDHTFDEVDIDDYDAIVVPGGAVNADSLRMVPAARQALKEFMDLKRPLAVICHAPWVLASAGLAKGRKLTSYFTIQDDMRNAGADWVDQEVVIDDNLITSRKPDDLPAFNSALIRMMAT